MKKLIFIGLFIGLAYLVWNKLNEEADTSKSTRPQRKTVVAVEIAQVKNATIIDMGYFTGSLYPQQSFIVAPKIAGQLKSLAVDIGDTVTNGQLIAEIEDEEFRLQTEQARAEILVAKANLKEADSSFEIAKRDLKRTEGLYEKKLISDSELDTRRSTYKACEAKKAVAEALVIQKETALKTADVRLSYAQIRATWENEEERVVGEKFVDVGAMLKANDPIVSILNINVLKGLIFVIERDYPRIKVGQETKIFTDAFPGRSFVGRISRIAPQLKESIRMARAEIDVPNYEQLLKPGMFIRVEVIFACHDNATVVPLSAVVQRDGRSNVFVVDRDKLIARLVPVEVGVTNNNQTEILAPQLTGWVVTVGHHLLSDGASVLLPGEKTPETSKGPKTVQTEKKEGSGRKGGSK